MVTTMIRWARPGEDGTTRESRIEVPVVESAEGLAVTGPLDLPGGGYTITHLSSGGALWPRSFSSPAPTPQAAGRALQVALASDVDWTQPVDAIRAQLGPDEAIGQLLWRMKLAAFPPRRRRTPCWHRQRRRGPRVEAIIKRARGREWPRGLA